MENDFQRELAAVLNKYSAENGSNTPDFILARYLTNCLEAFNDAIGRRGDWYGRLPGPGPGGVRDYPGRRNFRRNRRDMPRGSDG